MKVGPFLDETDGKTAETALTISQADVRLAKNAGDWAQKNESTTLVHEEAGWYRCLLDTTDTDTVGILMLAIHESGALPVWVEFHVVVANVYDSLFGAGTDKLDVNVEEWNTTAVPSEHTAGYPIVTVKDGTGTGEINTNGGKVVGVELVDTLTTYTGNTVQTGDSYAIVNSGTHGNAAIKGFVDDIGVAGAGLSAIPWNAAWDAEVQSEVQDAIEANNLDHLVKIAVDTDFATTVHLNSVVGHLADNGSVATFDRTTDSLEALQAEHDATQTTIGAAGAGLSAIPWNAAWDAEVQSEVQDSLEANQLDHLIQVADPGGIVANSSLWAALTSKSATPAYSSYNNTTDSLEANRDNIGTTGGALVLAKTTNITGFNDLSAAQVNTEADSALSDVGVTTTVTGRIDAAVSTRATPAQVNTEVLDVLNVDTFAEPGQEAPAATNTLAKKIGYLFKAWRNKKTQTSTERKLYADDATTVDQKATDSDDGTTFTKGELGTGP